MYASLVPSFRVDNVSREKPEGLEDNICYASDLGPTQARLEVVIWLHVNELIQSMQQHAQVYCSYTTIPRKW